MKNTQPLDFQEINNAVLANPSYLRQRLPDSHKEGDRLHAGTFEGGEGRSFNLNLKTGQWHDQATGDSGGDVVALVAAQEKSSQGEAARLIVSELGLYAAGNPNMTRKGLPEIPPTMLDWANPSGFYIYFATDGTSPYTALRFEKTGYRKTYRTSKGHTEKGSWDKSGIEGIKRVLYNLLSQNNRPGVIDSDFVVVVEGENKVEALLDLGICATCNLGGAGKWKDEYSEFLKGKDVLILPDNDKPGKDHAAQVAKSVSVFAKSVKVLELPGLPPKGDIIDWLKVPGNDQAKLVALMDSAPEWRVEQPKPTVKSIALEDFLKLELKPREQVLHPILPERGTSLLFSYRGVGKTHLALGIAYAIASGTVLFSDAAGPKWYAPKPRKVLYVDGEMAPEEMFDRLKKIQDGAPVLCQPGYFNFYNSMMQPDDIPQLNLTKPEGRGVVEQMLTGIDVLIVDNLATLCPGGKENETESWRPMQDWLLGLRRQGKAVLLLHHAGKGGDQRGASAREDILDTVIRMARPADYIQEEDGARFNLEFTKARGMKGKDVAPFEVTVTTVDGKRVWLTKDIGKDLFKDAVELIKQGKSYQLAANDLGTNKAMIQRIVKKAKERGLL